MPFKLEMQRRLIFSSLSGFNSLSGANFHLKKHNTKLSNQKFSMSPNDAEVEDKKKKDRYFLCEKLEGKK